MINLTAVANINSALRGSAGVSITNSIVWNNANGDYSNLAAGVFYYCSATGLTHGVQSNITNAPVFVDAGGGDYQLAKGSPGIDGGQNQGWMAGAFDLAGEARIKGRIVDMGAFEAPPRSAGIMLSVQ